MSHCKICDILFVIFCLFCFVFYVNPQNFSAESILKIKERNAERKRKLDEISNQDKIVSACLGRTNVRFDARYSTNKGVGYTHAVKQIFSYKNNQCEMRIEEYYLEGIYFN